MLILTLLVQVVLHAPVTNTEMARTQPGATLQPDAFDAPAATAVAEASKARGHEHHDHEPAAAAAAYVCPMHPEVTSATPGSCPKCGMSLVKKEQ